MRHGSPKTDWCIIKHQNALTTGKDLTSLWSEGSMLKVSILAVSCSYTHIQQHSA